MSHRLGGGMASCHGHPLPVKAEIVRCELQAELVLGVNRAR